MRLCAPRRDSILHFPTFDLPGSPYAQLMSTSRLLPLLLISLPAAAQLAPCRPQLWLTARSVVNEIASLEAELPREDYLAAVEDFASRLEPLLPDMSSVQFVEAVNFVFALREMKGATSTDTLKLSNSLSALLLDPGNPAVTLRIAEALVQAFRSPDRNYPLNLERLLQSLQAAGQRCRV